MFSYELLKLKCSFQFCFDDLFDLGGFDNGTILSDFTKLF